MQRRVTKCVEENRFFHQGQNGNDSSINTFFGIRSTVMCVLWLNGLRPSFSAASLRWLSMNIEHCIDAQHTFLIHATLTHRFSIEPFEYPLSPVFCSIQIHYAVSSNAWKGLSPIHWIPTILHQLNISMSFSKTPDKNICYLLDESIHAKFSISHVLDVRACSSSWIMVIVNAGWPTRSNTTKW